MKKRGIVCVGIVAAGVMSCATSDKPAASASAAGCSAERFLVKDDLVTDSQTRLTWRRCPLGPTFDRAAGNCPGAIYVSTSLAGAKAAAGRVGSGWRLPTVEEIGAIAGPSCKEEFARLFPNVSAPVWTSSSAGPGKAYQFDSSDGPSAEDENDAAAIVLLVKK